MYSYIANKTIILRKLGLNYREPPFKRRKRSLPLADGPHYSKGFKAERYDNYESCANDNSQPFSKYFYTSARVCSAFHFLLVVTDKVRSAKEGNVFTAVSDSIQRGGGLSHDALGELGRGPASCSGKEPGGKETPQEGPGRIYCI